MKTFSVHFIDGSDGHMNHKLIEAERIDYVCAYMIELGHEITKIQEENKMTYYEWLDAMGLEDTDEAYDAYLDDPRRC